MKTVWICPQCSETKEGGFDPVPRCNNGHSSMTMARHSEVLRLQRRTMVTPSDIGPKRVSCGPLKYAAFTAFVCVFASILAWIWLGDWEWAPTALVLLVGRIFLREGSLKDAPPWRGWTN